MFNDAKDKNQNIEYVSIVDHRSFNLLMLAAEAENFNVVNELLGIGFPVNEIINEITAADLAYENNHQNILLALLKSGSKYPSNFNPVNASGVLKKFLDLTLKFFKDIEEENFQNIEDFLTKNPKMTHILNFNNTSAVAKAIQRKRFDVLEIFQKFQLSLASFERFHDLTEGFNEQDLLELEDVGFKGVAEEIQVESFDEQVIKIFIY